MYIYFSDEKQRTVNKNESSNQCIYCCFVSYNFVMLFRAAYAISTTN